MIKGAFFLLVKLFSIVETFFGAFGDSTSLIWSNNGPLGTVLSKCATNSLNLRIWLSVNSFPPLIKCFGKAFDADLYSRYNSNARELLRSGMSLKVPWYFGVSLTFSSTGSLNILFCFLIYNRLYYVSNCVDTYVWFLMFCVCIYMCVYIYVLLTKDLFLFLEEDDPWVWKLFLLRFANGDR